MVSNSNFVFVLVGEPNLLVEVELKEATNGMTLVVQDETIKMQANQSIMCSEGGLHAQVIRPIINELLKANFLSSLWSLKCGWIVGIPAVRKKDLIPFLYKPLPLQIDTSWLEPRQKFISCWSDPHDFKKLAKAGILLSTRSEVIPAGLL